MSNEDTVTLQLSVRHALNLPLAKAIALAAEAEATKYNWAVAIAIVDDGEHLLYFQRMDGIPNASVEVAIAKAVHAVHYRRTTHFHEDLLTNGTNVVLGLPNSMPIEGGIPFIVDGRAIGAIGVSGVQSHQDGQIAAAGAAVLVQFLEQ